MSEPRQPRHAGSAAAWLLIAICACSVVSAASAQRAAPAQQQLPSGVAIPEFRAGVELVVLNVAVLDGEGEPLTDLTAADFHVREDGVEQEITLFASPGNAFLDVALVLDASSSIALNAPTIREDAMAFLAELGRRDCVYFVPFQGGVGQPMWAAPDDPMLAARIGGMELDGGTALYDALQEGLANVHRGRGQYAQDESASRNGSYDGRSCGAPLPPASLGIPGTVRRAAVVVLSDGGDEHSLATYADTLGAVWSDTVPIFAVAIGDALPPPARGTPRWSPRLARSLRRRQELAETLAGRLGYLAHISGGRLILGQGRDPLRESFATVVGMLRSSYLVGYRPPQHGEAVARGGLVWHQVDLDVPGRGGVELFARPGYYRRLVDTRGAERIVRATLEEVRSGSAESALQQLGVATLLDPGYWPVYLQRARAQLRLDNLEAARDDLLRALELRPGTVVVHRLLAETAYKLGDGALAWRHGIRAHQGGAQVVPLLRALEELEDPPEDLQAQLRAARVFVDIGATPDELDQGTLAEVLRALRNAVSDAPDLALMAPWNAADVGIILDVEKVRGSPRRLEGELVLTYAPYLAWEDENVAIEDVDDPASIANGIARALQKVRRQLNEFR